MDAQSKKEFIGLTDEELKTIQDNSWIIHSDEHKEFNTFKFARAIEQALRIKNGN